MASILLKCVMSYYPDLLDAQKLRSRPHEAVNDNESYLHTSSTSTNGSIRLYEGSQSVGDERQKTYVKTLHKATTIMTFTMVNVAEKGRYIFYFVTFMFLKYHMSHPHLIVCWLCGNWVIFKVRIIFLVKTMSQAEVFLTTFCGIWELGMPPHNSGVTMIPPWKPQSHRSIISLSQRLHQPWFASKNIAKTLPSPATIATN